MKIAVTRCDGDTEIIVLNEPVQVFEGNTQAHIHSADGMDYYFRKSDGCYDGWSMGFPSEGWTPDQAKTLIESVLSQRAIVPLTLTRFIELKLTRYWRRIVFWKGCALGLEGYPRWFGRKP